MTSSRRTPIQGHFARKRFGQNFLVDRDIINAIVDCIGPRAGEQIVEIGPGLGALTGPLAEALGTPLHVVELDRDLIVRLHKNFGERLVVHAGDALAFDFGALAEEARATLAKATAIAPVAETPAPSSMRNDGSSPRVSATTGGPSIRRVVRSEDAGQPAAPASQSTASLRIVGNLPYNISSPLLFHLMRFADRVIDQHFMLQDEVVERMVATPGSKAYSRLSVMLQFRYAMDKLLDVPPESFDPAPKVNSAIVRMLPHPQANLPDVDPKRFAEVVGSAFSQRRKMLRNTLGSYRDRIDFEALGFDLSRRAEDVSVAEYVTVAQKLAQSGD